MDGAEFLTRREAARRLGLSPHALTRRTKRGELPVYRDPADYRRLLIRVDDLEAFARPRPATPAKEVPMPAG